MGEALKRERYTAMSDNPPGEGRPPLPPLLSQLEAALQWAHAETVRAKDETIATLREQRDGPPQSPQPLAARAPDTAGGQDTQAETLATLRRRAEAAEAAPQVAERGRDKLHARLSTFVGPARTPPAATGDAEGAQRGGSGVHPHPASPVSTRRRWPRAGRSGGQGGETGEGAAAEVSVPPVVVVASQDAPEGQGTTAPTPVAHRGVQGLWRRLRRALAGG
ncbi:MAG: hypothetical protein AVDCRST_MAG88-1118 [uncultured Thermomicrobiales bacterium]|uniref:Uncharacterized protein n=1 Tax=uncultured Thermomicrobiales bacterium TaxID=1645740 RepID=A0A6J4URG9_9BACT|nr:MAG: hypothetical protein AVDCRST_MAG88-1118 [uncultured Thermomicrobiales bacterium]